jgi:hypothetical protein
MHDTKSYLAYYRRWQTYSIGVDNIRTRMAEEACHKAINKARLAWVAAGLDIVGKVYRSPSLLQRWITCPVWRFLMEKPRASNSIEQWLSLAN